MRDVLAIILGGGRGTRLFPLTHSRSKPAVPIGGKYRLIDIPISSCLHSEIRRIFVLTQFNSASLNRHIGKTYRLDGFSDGFVEILAAEQTPDSLAWFQGTADAVRQARRHFEALDADYYLILAGDHLYRMDYAELVESHTERGADITLAAQPVTPHDATEMGIFRFDHSGQIAAFEEKPNAARLAEIGGSLPPGAPFLQTPPDKPFVASMGIYVFSRQVLLDVLEQSGIDFGKEIIPAALGRYNVNAFLHRGYWADVGTIGAYYEANLMLTRPDPPFRFNDPKRPIFTHPRQLPPSRFDECVIKQAVIAEGMLAREELGHRIGCRRRMVVRAGSTISRSVLVGADSFEGDDEAAGLGRVPRPRHRPRRGDRPRHHRQERPHRRRLPAGERIRGPGSGRRRLVHPIRHRCRAQERDRQTGHGRVSEGKGAPWQPLLARSLCGPYCLVRATAPPLGQTYLRASHSG
jgi:glucose-1-phosphate adenylyltransferase